MNCGELQGKRMYRGLLENVVRVWNPKDTQDLAIQEKVLAHMQAAERGFHRLDPILDRGGAKVLDSVLHSLNLTSIERIDNLKALREIVVTLEAAVSPNRSANSG